MMTAFSLTLITIGLYLVLIYSPVDWVLQFELGNICSYPKYWMRTAILITTRTRVSQLSGTAWWQIEAKAMYITHWRQVKYIRHHSGVFTCREDAEAAMDQLNTAIARAIRA